jgi:hypothetical protein
MIKIIHVVFLLVAALTLPVNLYADELSINIKAITQFIRKGEVPKFNVSITNSSTTSIRIVDVVSRQDLKDVYTKLIVTKSGKPIDIPIAISDPGPIDFLVLAPNQVISFIHNGSPLMLNYLDPGLYDVTLKIAARAGSILLSSNTITFEIVP